MIPGTRLPKEKLNRIKSRFIRRVEIRCGLSRKSIEYESVTDSIDKADESLLLALTAEKKFTI